MYSKKKWQKKYSLGSFRNGWKLCAILKSKFIWTFFKRMKLILAIQARFTKDKHSNKIQSKDTLI